MLAVPGDITQKGYEKKKNKLLAPFLEKLAAETAAATAAAAVECQQLPAPPPPEQLEAAGNGTAPVAAADSEEPTVAAAANSNKARGSRRTHRRYYNEKRYHSEASIKLCYEKSKEGKYTVCAAISLSDSPVEKGVQIKGPIWARRETSISLYWPINISCSIQNCKVLSRCAGKRFTFSVFFGYSV